MMLIHFICISLFSLFYQHSMALKAAKEKKKENKRNWKKSHPIQQPIKKKVRGSYGIHNFNS